MTASEPARIIRQDPRSYTVKICVPGTDTVVGTGILLSRDGLIMTCAHVLRSGGVDPRRHEAEVGIYLPARRGGPAGSGLASVLWFPPEHDDDLVCLRFHGQLPPHHQQVAALGLADDSRDNRFISYGYRRLQRYHAGLADGVILGGVEPPGEATVLADPVQLRSSQINTGMSGAGVLDMVRNLVVGVVSETWYADETGKDRDTAWAVDARVLTFARLPLSIRDEALPLELAEPPNYDPMLADRALPAPGHRLEAAPAALPDWIGRREVLGILDEIWDDDRTRVVGLIGFGGEGKSSVARQWVDTVIARSTNDRPPQDSPQSLAGAFWWSFGERANADEFLAGAITYMSGGQVTGAEWSRNQGDLAAAAAGMMSGQRYLFILDGLEALQHQRGDEYGSVTSDQLRDFLRYAATPGRHSLCVLTSRAPVLDLAPYVTYQHVAVLPLGVAEGNALLRRLGVVGADASLNQMAIDWAGHALTLTLLAAYLVKRHGGDARRVTTLPAPDPALPRDEQVRGILREYDACLSPAERQLLTRCSVFRAPVALTALQAVADLPDWASAQATLNYLVAARVLRRDVKGRYGLHPLVRDFYVEHGRRDADSWRALHAVAQRQYEPILATGGPVASLEDLAPAVEAAHHACQAGAYDSAEDIVYDQLYQGDRGLITYELNAYETLLSVFSDFFPQQELHRQPLVGEPGSRAWILHEVAVCQQMLGRLREAAGTFRRAGEVYRDLRDWEDATNSCHNLVALYLHLGALPTCHRLIREASELATRTGDPEAELVAETLRGELAHLEGRQVEAEAAFQAALRIAAEHTPLPFLYSVSGVRYAELLFRTDRKAEAAEVHRQNLKLCEAAGWQADLVRCRVGLGDVALATGDAAAARDEYEEAVRIARGITQRDTLIAGLLGRGRWALSADRPAEALADVIHALQLATLGGYRLAEVDARILLARVRAGLGEPEATRSELTQATEVSVELGYYWGQHDAAQARAVTERSAQDS